MHAEKLIGTSYHEQRAWDALLHSPFPKLTGGFVKSSEYAAALREAEICTDWQQQMGFTSDSAVPARFFTYCVTDGETGDIIRSDEVGCALRKWTRREAMVEDLHKLGVRAVPFRLRTSPPFSREHFFINHGFYLPRHQPNLHRSAEPAVGAPQAAKSVPDFEGAVMFLAYLLHKGYVTKQDAPAGDAVYAQQDLSVPFGRTMFTLAGSIEYQNRVREGLGEPLLSRVGAGRVGPRGG